MWNVGISSPDWKPPFFSSNLVSNLQSRDEVKGCTRDWQPELSVVSIQML